MSNSLSPALDLLPAFNQSLEVGLVDNNVLERLFTELETVPERLLPHELGTLGWTAFLLYKNDRRGFALRVLSLCVRWCQKAPAGRSSIGTLVENIQHILKQEGHTVSEADVLAMIERDSFDHVESWQLPRSGLDDVKPVAEISGAELEMDRRLQFSEGFRPQIRSKLPLTVFHGWLKRLDPATLNAAGKLLIRDVFPLFASGGTVEAHIERTEKLASSGVAVAPEEMAEIAHARQMLDAGLPVKVVRHRRFAGGDGLLPRGCYASLCRSAAGDDGGTLNRELLAYVDRRIPGQVLVADSSDERCNAALGHPVGVMPGYCATYVLLFAPQSQSERQIFRSVYRDLLAQCAGDDPPLHVFALETRVDESEIDHVLDLRLPQTQQWFFDHFKNGDGHFLRKQAGTVREFYDLIPTLMHPALGGCNVTHAIGSWMRSQGVNALIYPSARSDAFVLVRSGALTDFGGWNIVDYRTARELPATEVTNDPGGWPDFVQPGVQLHVASEGELSGSWKVVGLQSSYDAMLQQLFGEPESKQVTPATDDSAGYTSSPICWWLERLKPGRYLEAEIKCPACGWESTYLPRDELPPEECPQCGCTKRHGTEDTDLPDLGPSS